MINKIFGKDIIEDKVVTQLENCLSPGDIGVLTADAHYGYSMPVGGAIAYPGKISVSGVGFDIGCGNKAVCTDIMADDVDVEKVMKEITRRISFGVGRPNDERVGHAVLDKIAHASFKPQRELLKLATEQLGTVGSGNHFIDLFKGDDGKLWIGVHFGSRGFGHKTATGFIAISQGLDFTDKGKEGSMDSKPVIFDDSSPAGEDYIEAMQLAGEYAYAGRDCVVNKVLEILGNPIVTFEVHNHHNFAWEEKHFGKTYWVVRKGCTPAFPGQYGFIGANMADASVIIQGVDCQEARDGLYSTVHGAGRILSRTQAAGKKKWIKNDKGVKRPVHISKGLVDFDEVSQMMRNKNIVLKGSGADEAPQCYKKLVEVLDYQLPTIKVIHTLYPIGVAMAGDVYDPYKD